MCRHKRAQLTDQQILSDYGNLNQQIYTYADSKLLSRLIHDVAAFDS